VKRDGKYSFIDETGEEIIPLKYDYAGNIRGENRAYVHLNGRKFYIDKT
jgi:hypothetical protein